LNDQEGVQLLQARVRNSGQANQGAFFDEGSILLMNTHIMLFVQLRSFHFLWPAKRGVQCCFCPWLLY